MRLSSEKQELIKHTLQHFFGERSQIYLFGSRVDDNAFGGDIDLYIEPDIEQPDDIVEAKLNALVELHKVLGDQKIDLIINRKVGKVLPVYRIAKETGVEL